jgi:hypothetical protein
MIYTGDIVERDGKPVLTNKREAIRLNAPDCVGAEPQDFRNYDRELVFVCYEYDMARKAMNAKVRGSTSPPARSRSTSRIPTSTTRSKVSIRMAATP